MREILFLQNTIQPYAWGSRTAIPELLGRPNPDGLPQAELWMGAHPKAPSVVQAPGGAVPLDALIDRCPDDILGPRVSAAFERKLPFLFKVLAAAEPLSIQAHPNAVMARAGYARENRLGLPLDAPERNYRDPNHKPECLCALTPFRVLCGFQPPAQILDHLRTLCPRGLEKEIRAFAQSCDAEGVKHLFAALLALKPLRRREAVAEAVSKAEKTGDENLGWIPSLARRYPDDIGALAPALMNCLRLEPGQALFLTGGVLHAYLEGTGIELMANSDNVVRAGLTSKHIDIPELFKVVRFDGPQVRLVRAATRISAETMYITPAAEFALSVIHLNEGDSFGSKAERNVEILLCIDGKADLAVRTPGGKRLEITKGESVLVPAAAPAYRISGPARLYKATVP
jgi:mannose-6-phosphate isomerase